MSSFHKCEEHGIHLLTFRGYGVQHSDGNWCHKTIDADCGEWWFIKICNCKDSGLLVGKKYAGHPVLNENDL